MLILLLSRWHSSKESACQCRRCKRPCLNPWGRKILGEGNGNLLQYSCLENSMDRGTWKAAVHGVAKSQTQPSNWANNKPVCKSWKLVEQFLFLDYIPLRMDNEKLFLQLYIHTLLWVTFFFTQYLLVLCYEQQVFSLWTFSIIYLPFVHYLTSNIPFEIIILSQYFILHSEICLSFFYLSVLNNIY